MRRMAQSCPHCWKMHYLVWLTLTLGLMHQVVTVVSTSPRRRHHDGLVSGFEIGCSYCIGLIVIMVVGSININRTQLGHA